MSRWNSRDIAALSADVLRSDPPLPNLLDAMDVDAPSETPVNTTPDPVSSEQTGLTRAEGLWFEDCGLIIQAENTIFRISRDWLALQSPIFQDMLALPIPVDAEKMEGYPFVRLPDTAEEVSVFLKALLCYGFFEAHPASTTFHILGAVLNMSHKYEVAVLWKHALTHVSHFYPTTLSDWDQLDGKSSEWQDDLLEEPGETSPIIALARRLSIDWILPAAFYHVSRFTEERVLLASDTLDLSDKILCMSACRLLEAPSVSDVLDFLWSPQVIDGCLSPEMCTKRKFTARRAAEKKRKRDVDEAPLMSLRIWEEKDWEILQVCPVCLPTLKIAHQQARQSLWDRLPVMFNLPDWAELKKRKADALK
ncbi:BTB domain-containing protein [Mycena venus]|uniref:BTB domain-containing protein n=1 Tax=Mycena venus TaxID=2733690 RepID=A0A8H7CVV4_9AGAR|nr:BTB domain-containing protein [Mycena venus]